MKIYEIDTQNKILGVYPIDDYEGNLKYDHMQKGSKKKYFKDEFTYELIDGENNKYVDEHEEYSNDYIIGNIVEVGMNLFFDEKALEKTRELFDENIEVFSSTDELKKYNYINIIDGLDNAWDKEKTEYKSFGSNSSKVLKFLSAIQFHEDAIKDKHIFKINEHYPYTYVSDTFKKIYDENKLIGLDFYLVWDSEGMPENFEMNPITKK